MQQYLGLHCRALGYGRSEHKADSLIAKFKEAGGTWSERLMYEQSSPRLSPARYLHHRPACHGLLIITVITPLPTKPSDKNARELKLANAITDMQMRQRDVVALDAKYTKELADAKAEMMLMRMMLPLVVVGCIIKAVCQSA